MALPGTATAFNPIDDLIDQIEKGSHYLGNRHFERLKALLPFEDQQMLDEGDNSLKRQLNQQLRLCERMQLKALSSENMAEMKQVADVSRNLFGLIVKFQEQMALEERSLHIENAIVEALNELGNDEIKASFKQKLAEKLAKAAKKS